MPTNAETMRLRETKAGPILIVYGDGTAGLEDRGFLVIKHGRNLPNETLGLIDGGDFVWQGHRFEVLGIMGKI